MIGDDESNRSLTQAMHRIHEDKQGLTFLH